MLAALMWRNKLRLLLDEAENGTRQHDIRGRRKSYATLYRLARQRDLFCIVFVTDRFFQQVADDVERGTREGWYMWTEDARAFLANAKKIALARPPMLDANLAKRLVEKMHKTYVLAFGISTPTGVTDAIIKTWERTSTRSVRLLVRLTIEALDSVNG